MSRTGPDDITASVLASFASAPDPRLGEVMAALVTHLHGFVKEVGLTEAEWRQAISVLTASGHVTTESRQEWILWSDALGVSMLVDSLANQLPDRVTESTVLGPFYAPGSPLREYGSRIDEQPAGEPTWVHGTVRDLDGEPIPGAEVDVWQNGDDELYAVQDPEVPDDHLRGRFLTRDDGSFGFVTVRPTPYPIPDDGPVGRMLSESGRHPWRPAHIHMVVRASGYRSLTTHIFDGTSRYIDSDAVFAVKPSLFRDFERRPAGDPERPDEVDGDWYSVRSDFVLAAGESEAPLDPGRTA